MSVKFLVFIPLAILAAGCDWVDSTGVQADDSQPAILLEEGLVVPLLEKTSRTLDPVDALQSTDVASNLVWTETPLQQGRLPGCASVENFASGFAVDSLQQACVVASDCQLYFEPTQIGDEEGQRAAFNLRPPAIKAPVGLTYQLVAASADGIETQANFTFCLIAENEPPVAASDTYPVVVGSSLIISPNGSGLLANDTDDTASDVRNQPLSIVLPALTQPTLAESFQLFADGGFVYTPDRSVVLPPGGSRTDVFEYQITDGTHTDNATVLINIVAQDGAPQLLQNIPDSLAIVGIKHSTILSKYFSDPEGGELSFAVNTASLPPSGSFALDTAGVLSGSAQPQDVGSWTIDVTATDVGNQSAATTFTLMVVDNLPPNSTRIPAQIADTQELFMLDTSLYFSDDESVPLRYALTGIDSDMVVIDRVSGIISGFFAVAGEYELTVSVSDGVNQPVSQTFLVSAISEPNRAPTYSELIPNQSLEVGQVLLKYSR